MRPGTVSQIRLCPDTENPQPALSVILAKLSSLARARVSVGLVMALTGVGGVRVVGVVVPGYWYWWVGTGYWWWVPAPGTGTGSLYWLRLCPPVPA